MLLSCFMPRSSLATQCGIASVVCRLEELLGSGYLSIASGTSCEGRLCMKMGHMTALHSPGEYPYACLFDGRGGSHSSMGCHSSIC